MLAPRILGRAGHKQVHILARSQLPKGIFSPTKELSAGAVSGDGSSGAAGAVIPDVKEFPPTNIDLRGRSLS